MTTQIYRIVEHDGGWAYQADGVFSETFPSHDAAFAAACRVAREQRTPGESARITWEDAEGHWHADISLGDERPGTEVRS